MTHGPWPLTNLWTFSEHSEFTVTLHQRDTGKPTTYLSCLTSCMDPLWIEEGTFVIFLPWFEHDESVLWQVLTSLFFNLPSAKNWSRSSTEPGGCCIMPPRFGGFLFSPFVFFLCWHSEHVRALNSACNPNLCLQLASSLSARLTDH